MYYKIEGAIKRNRTNFIIYAVLWIIIAIVLVPSFAYSTYMAKANGSMDFQIFIGTFGQSITNPLGTFSKVFEVGATETYFSTLLVITIVYSIFFFIGLARSAPKNQYTDIEHGSSDWSQRGEQYQILNRSEGIILAENNYLPVDKRGNVNVLVVGRIWFW